MNKIIELKISPAEVINILSLCEHFIKCFSLEVLRSKAVVCLLSATFAWE